MAEELELGRDLGAADDRGDRMLRALEGALQRVELGAHGAARISGQAGDGDDRGVGGMLAMRRRKRIVDEEVAERGEAAGELAVVVFFLGMKAGVFQAKNIAVLHRGDRALRRRPDAVLGKRHRLFDDPRHRGGDGLERILGIAAFRPVQMRQKNDLAALAGELGNGRGDLFDAG